jgi:hypothetical protein
LNKYRNKKTVVGGLLFDSKKEASYYTQLMWRKKAGEIKEIMLQEKFKVEIEGKHICYYLADFVIVYPDGRKEVIDVKSEITKKNPVYRLKKKLVEALYKIKIIEI